MPKSGHAHHNAKLTDKQVIEMRDLYETWKEAKSKKGYGELAYMFGCGESTVRDIVQYRTRNGCFA